MKIHFIIFSVLIGASICGWAQKSGTETMLGTTSLKLGMTKEEVIKKLAGRYRVGPDGDEDWWGVDSQPPYTAATPFDHFASLTFESGRLAYVIKRHFSANRGTSVIAFANALHVIVAGFIQDQGNSCTVAAPHFDSITYEVKKVLIQCGSKVLSLELGRSPDHAAVTDGITIEEVIGILPTLTHPITKQ
jgi:hypothetical protein